MNSLTYLLIAQVSSSITSILGIIAIFMIFRAIKGLVSDEFKQLITYASIFLIITTLAVISMTFYHILNGTELSEKLELIWYVGIFISILFSLVESYKIISFGKNFVKPTRKRR